MEATCLHSEFVYTIDPSHVSGCDTCGFGEELGHVYKYCRQCKAHLAYIKLENIYCTEFQTMEEVFSKYGVEVGKPEGEIWKQVVAEVTKPATREPGKLVWYR